MRMDNVREEYLRWLYPQLKDNHAPTVDFWGLTNAMFDKEFRWSVDHDDNRIADGLDLRVEFAHVVHVRRRQMEQLGPCSFLEVLIGLSRRLAFMAGGEAAGWAWQLIINLELDRMPDPFSSRRARQAEKIMEVCVKRQYAPDGQGGFFPLAWPDEDQTKIELWYQMNSYAEEIHPEH